MQRCAAGAAGALISDAAATLGLSLAIAHHEHQDRMTSIQRAIARIDSRGTAVLVTDARLIV